MSTRKWLQALIDQQYLPAIRHLQNTSEGHAEAQKWANWMKQQWVSHGMKALKQQRNLMTAVRNTIKQQLGEDHFALESMAFSKAEWTEINEPITEQVAQRNENHRFLDDPEAIVQKAASLLLSREWAEVAAGLVVLTGRRSSEILSTAQFEIKTPYSVIFTGALKRRGEKQILSFEIPTLAPAQQVVDALDKLRKWLPIAGMNPEAVNGQYGEAVARACDRQLHELVPLRHGKDNLYTHLFRTIYARIATHWYAPPRADDGEYMASIQGHYQILEENDSKLKRSLMASRHYNDYKIGDGRGNIDGRQGIKLQQPGVEVIEVFKSKKDPAATQAENSAPRKRKVSSLRLFQDERDRWGRLLEQATPEGTQPERMSALLERIEGYLESSPQQPEAATAARLPLPENQELEATLAKRVKQFVDQLKPLDDPAAIWELCQVELAELKRHYPLEVYLPHYIQGVEAAVHSAQLPLIVGQTADVERSTKQGVEYETRKHYALVFLKHPEYPRPASAAPPKEPLGMEETASSASITALAPVTDVLVQLTSRLDVQTQVLTRLVERLDTQPATGQFTHSDEAALPREIRTSKPGTSKVDTTGADQARQVRQARRGRSSAEAEGKINYAIDEIIKHNSQPDLPREQKWAITLSVLKTVTKSYQGVIQRVLEQRQEEIEQHHQRHGLGKYHNNVHRGTEDTITDLVQF